MGKGVAVPLVLGMCDGPKGDEDGDDASSYQ